MFGKAPCHLPASAVSSQGAAHFVGPPRHRITAAEIPRQIHVPLDHSCLLRNVHNRHMLQQHSICDAVTLCDSVLSSDPWGITLWGADLRRMLIVSSSSVIFLSQHDYIHHNYSHTSTCISLHVPSLSLTLLFNQSISIAATGYIQQPIIVTGRHCSADTIINPITE